MLILWQQPIWWGEQGRLTVTSLDLGVDLDTAVLRYHVFGNRHTLVDRDTLLDDGVVLHATPLSVCLRIRQSGMSEEGEMTAD
jgi:hypothetical protein